MSDQAEQAKLMTYASEKLQPVLGPMLQRLMEKKPENPVPFMLEHLRHLRGEQEKDTDPSKRSEKRLPRMTVEGGALSGRSKKGDRRRAGVSAESVDVDELAKTATRVIKKGMADVLHIKNAVQHNFLFTSLDEDQMKIVIDAMEPLEFQPGDVIIQQGDNGDDFYCLEQGTAECFVDFKNGQPPKCVKTYESGESFGELALMYNTPRAASIIAKTTCKLWGMDRTTFRKVLLTSTSVKRTKYEEFLAKVPLFNSLDNYERGTIADVLNERNYSDGSTIITEGEVGDSFFILCQGEAKAVKVFGDQPAVEVKRYAPGDYFGELALIDNKPRAASIVAVGDDVTVVSMDASSFTRLLGPMKEILSREKDVYVRASEVARQSIKLPPVAPEEAKEEAPDS